MHWPNLDRYIPAAINADAEVVHGVGGPEISSLAVEPFGLFCFAPHRKHEAEMGHGASVAQIDRLAVELFDMLRFALILERNA